MYVKKIFLTNVRNLSQVSLSVSPRVNLIYGDNGAGKTTLLEAIYFLALAKSFRPGARQSIIQVGKNNCTAFALLQETTERLIGISRSKSGKVEVKMDGKKIPSIYQIANILPIQLISPISLKLLESGPKERRAFLDWGVFHFDAGFYTIWKNFQRALLQRNSLLRAYETKVSKPVLAIWNKTLIRLAKKIHSYRKNYLQQFEPFFYRILQQLIDLPNLGVVYRRGWDEKASLEEVFARNFFKDLQLGYTQAGPHRAEFELKLGQFSASDVLSRGQLKLVVFALKIAQGLFLKESKAKNCVYLIDDLPSELDQKYRKILCNMLQDLHSQIFITSIDLTLKQYWQVENKIKLFHVKQNHVFECDSSQECKEEDD